MNITHIGGPTALIEYGGLRILTDPTFDPAGGKYNFGWGTGSVKTTAPAIAPDELGEIDLVLLTHDHHEDNLDAAGRAFLPQAGTVITTASGAQRLGHDARGLTDWESTELTKPDHLLMASFMNDWTLDHVAGYAPRSVNGRGAAPTGPGLGIDVDPSTLERLL